MNDHPAESEGRVPCLDGLRACCITIVVLAHSFMLWKPTEKWLEYFSWIAFNGRIGVSFFFVISGFIITYLLATECSKHGKISLRNFYIRRALRILPPYYFYISIVFLVSSYLEFGHTGIAEWISAIFFVRNMDSSANSILLEHTWSLNVEEQYYLIWPFLLAYLGPKVGLKVAFATVLWNPLIRWISNFIPGIPNFQVPLTLYFNLDYLMVGSLAALLVVQGTIDPLRRKIIPDQLALFAFLLVFVVSPVLLRIFYPSYLYFEGTIEAPCMAAILLWAIENRKGRIGRFLSHRVPVFIGTLSYSIYLWQQPFMPSSGTHWLQIFPANIIPIFAAAMLSYYLTERSVFKLRSRYRAR